VAPADKVLYGLRNETCTVESIPLIVGSILSKKLAEGVQRLVLDVKTGSGAFMKTPEASRELAEALVRVAKGAGVDCSAHITAMDRPLGRAVGNALEVRESADCLKGGGPDDLRELVVALAGHPKAAEVLASGAAYPRFLAMVEAQGGDPAAVDGGVLHGEAGVSERVVVAPRDGVITQVDAGGVGRAAFVLGAGRRRAEDAVDMGVGAVVHVKPGDVVVSGQPLVTLVHREGHALSEALAFVEEGVRVGDEAVDVLPLLVASVR
jgi:thymidine phosphorylase